MEIWIWYALLSALFASAVAILGKIGLQGIDVTLATSIRAVIMAVFLTGSALVLGKWKLLSSIDSRAFGFILVSGIAGALSWLFYFLALKLGPATGVSALDRLSVVFVFILAVIFLGEPLTWKTGVGSLFLLFGAFLMVWK